MGALTPKQEFFCQAYVETGNASEAYRQAYNCNGKSDNALHVEASRLLTNPKVALKVEELKAEHRERHDVTVDGLTAMLGKAYKVGLSCKQASAMTQAVMGMAKLHGLLTEKHEHTGKDSKDLIPEMTPLEAGRRLAFLFAQAMNTQNITRPKKEIREMPKIPDKHSLGASRAVSRYQAQG